MKIKNTNLRNFLTGGEGYGFGALAGVLIIYLLSKLGLARLLFSLIDPFYAREAKFFPTEEHEAAWEWLQK